MTRTRALRLALDEGRATGLMVRRRGREITLRARREVIVGLGTFGSPQLLLLSGIGPEEELRAHGIAPVHVLPGVGRTCRTIWTTRSATPRPGATWWG